jgi:hypothetical protein
MTQTLMLTMEWQVLMIIIVMAPLTKMVDKVVEKT